MKFRIALIGTVATLVALAAGAADTDRQYTGEQFKSDAKAAGKGIRDAAVNAGRQIGSGSKKAYQSASEKINQDLRDGKPGDGSLAKKNTATPTRR